MASGEGTWAVTRWTFSEWASCQVFLQFHYCALHQQERSQKPYLSTKTRNSTTSNPTKNRDPELGPHRSKNVFVLLQEIRSHHGSCKKVSKSQIHAKGEVTVHLLDDKNFILCEEFCTMWIWKDRCVAIGGHYRPFCS